MEQAIAARVLQTAVDNILNVANENFLFCLHCVWECTKYARHASRRPAIADPPAIFPGKRFLLTIPHMGEQFLSRIPQHFPNAFDLTNGLFESSGNSQERRQHIGRVAPNLWDVREVIENAIGATRRFLLDVLKQFVKGVLQCLISCLLCCPKDSFCW